MNKDKENTFGELIREALVEKGWSNAELARRTGFSATYIGNLIRDYSLTKSGKPTRLPLDTVDTIAKALQKPLPLFRQAAGLASPETSGELKSKDEVELISLYRQFPKFRQADILKIIRTFSNQPAQSNQASIDYQDTFTLDLQSGHSIKFGGYVQRILAMIEALPSSFQDKLLNIIDITYRKESHDQITPQSSLWENNTVVKKKEVPDKEETIEEIAERYNGMSDDEIEADALKRYRSGKKIIIGLDDAELENDKKKANG